MERRGVALPIVLIAVVLAIAIGTGVAVVWRTRYFDSALPAAIKDFLGIEEPPTESSTETPSETSEDPTKDWKSYTNEEIGLSFKYPDDWYIYPKDVSNEGVFRSKYLVEIASKPRLSSYPSLVPIVGYKEYYPPDTTVLRVILESRGYYTGPAGEDVPFKNVEDFIRGAVSESAELKKIKFGGKDWVETIAAGYNDVHNLRTLYAMAPTKKIYLLTFPKPVSEAEEESIELIASTIKFL